LKYAGMVGTGYDDKLLRDLRKKLRKIEKETIRRFQKTACRRRTFTG